MTDEARLSTEVIECDGIPLVRTHGEIDLYTAQEFDRAVQAGIKQDGPALIVDLSDTSYLDSAGVAVLFAAQKALAAKNAELHVVAPSNRRGVSRVLEIARLDALARVHASVEDALSESKPEGAS